MGDEDTDMEALAQLQRRAASGAGEPRWPRARSPCR